MRSVQPQTASAKIGLRHREVNQMLLYATRFEPKAVMRDVQPQTVSAKIGLRHREVNQMLLYATRFEPKAVMRDVQPQTVSAKIGLRHWHMVLTFKKNASILISAISILVSILM